MKSATKFLIAFGIIFILLFLVEYNQDEPVDWSPGFSKSQKKPFGTFLLYNLLPDIFKDQNIETVNFSITEQLQDHDTATHINYIFLDENIDLNEFECNALLHFVSRGNTVFIGSNGFPDTLMHSVALKLMSRYDDTLYARNAQVYHFNFCDQVKTSDTGYTLRNELMYYYFDSVESTRHWLAGDKFHCITTEIDYGKGKFILSTIPYAFTNYSLVNRGNAEFAATALARLPLQTVWWDEHYKVGKNKFSPLHVILSRKGLRWAYYIGISGLILFIVFMGKRRQRIIPLQDPMKNASLEFAETVGRLYYEKSDHLDLARKQVRYFYEYIRTKYQLNVALEWKENPEAFLAHLSQRSGKPLKEVQELFGFISNIEHYGLMNTTGLLKLNRMIEAFKK
jgi:hypothetical protein